MKHKNSIGIMHAVVTLVLLAGSSDAVVKKFTEDFNTTEYRDATNTTAWWNTAAGELRLYPFELSLVGTCDTPDVAHRVYVWGDYAYVADWGSGLQVIDISNPAAPVQAGACNTPLHAQDVHVSDDYAFVADGSSGLQVIDISNPGAPTLVGYYNTPGEARGVYVSGRHAFVADRFSGLQVIDISNPLYPSLVGNGHTTGQAWDVYVSGDHAFVADGLDGLQVIDISDPEAPTPAGNYNMPGEAYGIYVSGDHAYMAFGDAGFLVVDISNPEFPTLAGACGTSGEARDVYVWGDRAYVADTGSASPGFLVIDISNPAYPSQVAAYDTPSLAYGVCVSGDHAFVAGTLAGLNVIKISNPALPTLAGTYNTSGDSWGLAVSGDHAFIADDDDGLLVIDISDPSTPTLTGAYNTLGNAYGVAVAGDFAFVADKSAGLKVIDISDPTTPSLAGAYNTSGSADDIAVAGDFAFVADMGTGLQVIGISDPANPALVGTYTTPGTAYGVAVSGGHAFVADHSYGLQVIDISEPASPTLEGSYNTSGLAWGVDVAGDFVFVADMSAGLQVIDISDPANPALAGSCDTPGEARDVTVSGDYVFVADGGSGIQVIDISDPTTPTLSGGLNTSGWALDIIVEGDNAFMASGGSGLQVFQVYQREIDPDNNVGWSLAVDASADTIIAARLTTTQTDPISWELSADGGLSWQLITPDATWNQMAVPGTDLMWRSTLIGTTPGDNPSVSQLQVDWLGESATIDSIVDVPVDQGGWVRAQFTRSGRDFPDQVSLPIVDYGIWQRVDNPALFAVLSAVSNTVSEKRVVGEKPHLAAVPVITHQGRKYVQSRPGLATSSFPSGIWEWVATVPAIQQDAYVARVPTAADSSSSGPNYAVFVVTAHTTTPSIWYISDPDSGYSVDDIGPAVPTSFAVAYNTGSGNTLSWDACPDNDFQYFHVYRSNDPNFDPAPTDLVHTTIAASWNDPEYDGWNVYYRITALDFVGNESLPTSTGTVTAVSEPVIPQAYALYQNVPNPFNPATVISYDVPAGGGVVTLRVYDVGGRMVRTLVDGTEEPGEKTITWGGRNDRGRMVASGVYFYRLTSEGFSRTRKMLLMK